MNGTLCAACFFSSFLALKPCDSVCFFRQTNFKSCPTIWCRPYWCFGNSNLSLNLMNRSVSTWCIFQAEYQLFSCIDSLCSARLTCFCFSTAGLTVDSVGLITLLQQVIERRQRPFSVRKFLRSLSFFCLNALIIIYTANTNDDVIPVCA